MDLFKKMLIGAAAFFLVGATLGLLMPSIASAIGAEVLINTSISAGTLALWQGATFAVFGFLAPVASKITGSIIGDPDAKAAAQQQERLAHVESREKMLEQTVVPARSVQQILARGSRSQTSFASAEEARAMAMPESPTIH